MARLVYGTSARAIALADKNIPYKKSDRADVELRRAIAIF
jgi:hypothetical protein